MFSESKIQRLIKILIFFGLLILVAIIYSQKIDFTYVDLGRHLANGREIFHDRGLLFRNFYSYTEPNAKFINHHWLSGVIFYGLYRLGNFRLLMIFNILLALAAFSLAFKLAAKQAGFYFTALLSIPVIFLLSFRTEVRPEAFSVLFIMLVWWLIKEGGRIKTLWRNLALGALFILWANLHIYFIFGLALIGFKAAADFLEAAWPFTKSWREALKQGWLQSRSWFGSLGLAVIAGLANPNFFQGLIYPFLIFRNYAYDVAENKSFFFFAKMSANYDLVIFKLIFLLLLVSWTAYIFQVRKWRWFDIFATILFSFAALFAIRNLAIFSLAALVLISANSTEIIAAWRQDFSFFRSARLRQTRFYQAALIGVLILGSLIYLLVDASGRHSFMRNSLGWGVYEGSGDSIQFFKSHQLTGPIFNNYDLGSALIFWLYPHEKVFVDNRPEAYSPKFFSDIYRPLQVDPTRWQELSREYGFKTIYFAHTDQTPWAQTFLSSILRDSNWVLIYFDRYTVILLNRSLSKPEDVENLAMSNWAFRDRLRHLAADSDIKGKFDLASLAIYAGQNDLAQEIYHEILLRYPDQRQAIISTAYVYSNSLDREQLLESRLYFDRALKLGYKLPFVYIQRGLVNWRLKDYQAAEADWRHASKIDRGNTSAASYLEQIDKLKKNGLLPY